MERIQYRISGCLLAACLLVLAGCQPYAQKKQAMVRKWEASTARAKIPEAENLLQQGKIAEAQKILLQCLEAVPDLPQAHFLMGRICLAKGQIRQGRLYFLRAVELDDRMDQAWYALGVLEQNEGKLKEAETFIHTAFTLKPAEVQYILSMADIYWLQGRTERAEEFLQEQRLRQPNHPELLVKAAQLAQAKGEHAQAIQFYRQALLQKGDDPYLLETLGVYYMNQQQWLPAAETFEKLLDVAPAEARETVLSWLAQCTFRAGQYGRALSWYDRLSVFQRENPQLWLEMGQAALGAGLPDRALYCGRKALHMQPAWADAQVLIGCSLYLKKDYPGALPLFEKARRDVQWEGFSWWMAGQCYRKLGQNALARGAFEKASQISPDSPMMRLVTQEQNESL